MSGQTDGRTKATLNGPPFFKCQGHKNILTFNKVCSSNYQLGYSTEICIHQLLLFRITSHYYILDRFMDYRNHQINLKEMEKQYLWQYYEIRKKLI